MKNRRRRPVLVLTCSLVLALLLVAAPAEAKRRRLDLHKGSSGSLVTLLESRLSALGFLVPSAVDGKFRIATVHAVRTFQWRLGMPITGRVNRATWNAILREPSRRAASPRPLVLGHRGEVTSGAGENTLAALQAAAPAVNLLEFDLHLTADHVLVLMHDATLDRTTDCTGAVSSWTSTDLRDQCTVDGQPVPTFDEATAYAASVGKPIAPELKDPTMTQADLEDVADIIKAHGMGSRTWLQSVYGSRFRTLHAMVPGLHTILVSRGVISARSTRATGASGVAIPIAYLTIPRVRTYHAAHLRVWGWTARSTAELVMARAMRADAVVTDIPRTARAVYR